LTEREKAIRALREAGCSKKIVQHCLTVERTALAVARKIISNGHKLDLRLVSLGALLHDIGRARTHDIMHGVEGAKILRELGLGKFARFAECHLGAGIPATEAKELGLPACDFVPRTIEEKIVTYADKLVMGGQRTSYKRALGWFRSDLGSEHPAIKRFEELHHEIEKLSTEK
jgi:uncharacterized protein